MLARVLDLRGLFAKLAPASEHLSGKPHVENT